MKTAARTKRSFLVLLALFLALGLTSCGKNHGTTYPVDPTLRDFYNTLGGKDLFGLAISDAFTDNENQCQYTVSVLMCVDDNGHTFLYPLGASFASAQAGVEETTAATSLVVNGIPVYEEFIPLYKEFTGATVVGYPLAQAKLNYSQQRIEQYFANVGFYRNFNDEAGAVQLLAYGAAACGSLCDFSPPIDAAIANSTVPVTDRAFLAGLEKIGAVTIFGEPLTRAFLAADGMQEQVFQNAALYTSPGSSVIHLRQVPLIIGKPTSPAGTKLYGNKEGMVFYAVDGKQGYHVPQLFDDFIMAYGGTAISGMPIAEVSEVTTGIYRQCFENYCLLYTPSGEPEEQLVLEAIGSDYLAKISPADLNGETVVISPSTVQLKLEEQYALLQPKHLQRISILLRSQLDDSPLAGIEAQLVVSRPDGSTWSMAVPATMGNGTSSATVPYLEHVPNGSILRYEVCLTGIIAEPVCSNGSYVQLKLP